MKRLDSRCARAACLAIALAAGGSAQAEEGVFTLAAGAEYTTGDYGGDKSIDEVYVPVTGYYDTETFTLRLTVPFLQVRAPEGTISEGPGGEIIIGEGPRSTESGIGDVIAALTVYDVYRSPGGAFALDLTGKIKFGTADEDKGLGTGENDYSAQVDLFRFFDRFTAIGSFGYTVRGDPDDVDLDNAMFVSVGFSYRVSPATRFGAFYDYREASLSSNDDPQELSVFAAWRVAPTWVLRGYALAGLSDSSPDFGVGVTASKEF